MLHIMTNFLQKNIDWLDELDDKFIILEDDEDGTPPTLASEQTVRFSAGNAPQVLPKGAILSDSQTWKVMIVDDDAQVHQTTKLALKKFIFDGRSLTLFSAYSGEEAKQLIAAHPDIAFILLDIHDGIDSTLMILKHRLKANEKRPEIAVIKDYGDLPPIECYAGQLNQVFMNLLANAIDALDESNQGMSYKDISNKIIIKTELSTDRKQVIIRIKDNGIGMSEQVRAKIFDELFTTKGVGKGTGLGLAIARQIVVEKHGGAIDVNSTTGQGTEFALALPVCSLN